MKSFKNNAVLIALLAVSTFFANAQVGAFKVCESFDDGIPAELVSTGKISLDTQRRKYGENALKWEWKGNDQIVLNRHLGYHQQGFIRDTEQLQNGHGGSEKNPVLEPPRGFFVWIYNTKATQQRIRFQFGRGEKVDCEFDFNLNFTGWRTCAVGYDRGDMRGVPHPDMNRLTIHAPATGSGVFYFDMIGTSIITNPRTVSPNLQLPEIDQHPRLVAQYPHLLLEWSKYRPSFNLEPIDDKTKADFRRLEQNVEDLIYPEYERKEVNSEKLESLKKRYQKFEIVRDGAQIYGAPIMDMNVFKDYFAEISGTKDEVRRDVKDWRYNVGGLLFDLAKSYAEATDEGIKDEIESMFINLFDHTVDQGFDYGAGLGWLHHYSYIIREYAPAFYLMRDVLKDNDRLDKAIKVSKWFYGFNQCYNINVVYNVPGRKAGNADEIQGFMVAKLLCALMMEDSPEKARDIRHYSSYYSNVFTAYTNALDETYKPDGTFFHHAGHAFGYGGRAVYGGVSGGYALSGTQFAQTPESYQRMRKVAERLNTCLFTQDLMAPKAFASIRFSNYELPEQFYQIPALLACTAPEFDEEMAALYKNLISKPQAGSRADHKFWMEKVEAKSKSNQKFEYDEITQLPYSCVTVKRKADDWMIAMRGHSKYVYPFESWGSSFFAYPLFIANGYIDVSYPNSLDGQTPEGKIWYDGYDWHRWPGTTTIQLPYEEMETNPGQVRDEGGEYLFSDQAFAGGLETSYGAGISVFQFKGHDKFGIQGFTGKKSFFFFEDKVLCLGTDICSDLKDYDVETTLFQNVLKDKSEVILTNEKEISAFPYNADASKSKWIIDNRGTGYFILEGGHLSIQKKTQINPDAKGKNEVSGDFATALFQHGKAPENASYQYLLVADASKDEMIKLESNIKNSIKIHQKDRLAHVLELPAENAMAYAVYKKEGASFKKGWVKNVNKQSTFMVKEQDGKLVLSVADPDLNIYDGQDDLLPDGSRTELSIYEREWFYWPSRATKVRLTLKGRWEIEKQVKEMETAEVKTAKIVSSTPKETMVEFECRDGLSAEIILSK